MKANESMDFSLVMVLSVFLLVIGIFFTFSAHATTYISIEDAEKIAAESAARVERARKLASAKKVVAGPGSDVVAPVQTKLVVKMRAVAGREFTISNSLNSLWRLWSVTCNRGSWPELAKMNGIENPDRVFPGQVVVIPNSWLKDEYKATASGEKELVKVLATVTEKDAEIARLKAFVAELEKGNDQLSVKVRDGNLNIARLKSQRTDRENEISVLKTKLQVAKTANAEKGEEGFTLLQVLFVVGILMILNLIFWYFLYRDKVSLRGDQIVKTKSFIATLSEDSKQLKSLREALVREHIIVEVNRRCYLFAPFKNGDLSPFQLSGGESVVEDGTDSNLFRHTVKTSLEDPDKNADKIWRAQDEGKLFFLGAATAEREEGVSKSDDFEMKTVELDVDPDSDSDVEDLGIPTFLRRKAD